MPITCQPGLNRYWVSWWSSNHVKMKVTKPPFQFWSSGTREVSNPKIDNYEESLCAVIDANNESEIELVIKKHFPDYEMRFCDQTENDFKPNDRFKGFRGETSLK